MTCPRCKTENGADRRFCRSCGTAFGILCARCDHQNSIEDKFCGFCGFPISTAQMKNAADNPVSFRHRHLSVRQYSPQEIEELLHMRRAIQRERDASRTVEQNDIDEIFG
jgi:hypothetical protein